MGKRNNCDQFFNDCTEFVSWRKRFPFFIATHLPRNSGFSADTSLSSAFHRSMSEVIVCDMCNRGGHVLNRVARRHPASTRLWAQARQLAVDITRGGG